MRNRKIKARNQKLLRWSGIIISSLVIILFSVSLFTNQSPSNVIKSMWGDMSGFTDDPMKMNKRTLRSYVIKQNHLIDSLALALDDCVIKKGKKGVVEVDAPTLNMRALPSLSSNITLKIPNETEVIINYYDTERYYLDGVQGQWCNITHAGQTGWVWGPFVRKL